MSLMYILVQFRYPFSHNAWFKSIVYFMQIAQLLVPVNFPLGIVFAVFALDPRVIGIDVRICPWHHFSGIQKIASGYYVPCILLFTLGAVGLLEFCVRWSWRRLNKRQPLPTLVRKMRKKMRKALTKLAPLLGGEEHTQVKHRYIGVLTGLILLTYEGVTEATIELVHCTNVEGSGSRLFLMGEVTCYQSWQYPFIFLLVFLASFPFFLIGLQWVLLRRAKAPHATSHAFLETLGESYHPKYFCWEAVALIRRLLLLLLATFVLDPIWQALSLFFVCFLVALAHQVFQPYRSTIYGNLELMFLVILWILSALHLPQATYEALGQVYQGSTVDDLTYLVLSFVCLPFLVSLLVLLLFKMGYIPEQQETPLDSHRPLNDEYDEDLSRNTGINDEEEPMVPKKGWRFPIKGNGRTDKEPIVVGQGSATQEKEKRSGKGKEKESEREKEKARVEDKFGPGSFGTNEEPIVVGQGSATQEKEKLREEGKEKESEGERKGKCRRQGQARRFTNQRREQGRARWSKLNYRRKGNRKSWEGKGRGRG